MQNFSNSPAPLPPGFANRSGSVVGSPYPPHSADPQISPRTMEEYAALQQQTPTNPQGHGQHLLHRGQPHPGHAAHIHGYGSRNRSSGDGNSHGGGNSNLYRKEMDYYFSVGGRDRSRRVGPAYGAGFGYSNMDGHIPHQYRHITGSGTASGMMSPYPIDYGSAAGAGNGSSVSSAESFSPSHQYSMGQTASLQSVSGPHMHQRQKYPSHQPLHQGQQHRPYNLSGQRMPPQFSNYPPLGTPTGSAVLYSSPPQRYDGANSGAADAKVNNSPTHANPATSNNAGSLDNVGQSYPPSHPPYSPQPHSLHKHSQRTSQHTMGTGYDHSLKMQQHASQAGIAYSKHPQSSVSSSPALPQHSSHELSKSPMHSQPAQMHQNFSPISNPSPAASVQSPSCSSSSSPLMGGSEGMSNSAAPQVQPSSHVSLMNPRSNHSHSRLLQAVPQLSPTPHSNSSISSCGSSTGGKGSQPALSTTRMAPGNREASREDGASSMYQSCPQDKIMQDPGLNSLNALTSQVANLPNTVQHMMLTDSLLSHKKGKDGGQLAHAQQSSKAMTAQSKSHVMNVTLGHGSGREQSDMTAGDSDISERAAREDFSSSTDKARKGEHGEQLSDEDIRRIRQMSGTSNESETNSFYPASKNQFSQNKTEQSGHRLHLQVDTELSKKQPTSQLTSAGAAQTNTLETQTPSSSSPPSIPPSTEPSANLNQCSTISASLSSTPSPSNSSRSNCFLEGDVTKGDNKKALREEPEIKNETSNRTECEDKKWGTNTTHGRNHEKSKERHGLKNIHLQAANCKEEFVSPTTQHANKEGMKDEMQLFDTSKNVNVEPHSTGNVGVIVSTRSEGNQAELTKPSQATPASPRYCGPQHSSQHSYTDERNSLKFCRDSRNHNGDGDIDPYTAEYGQPAPSNYSTTYKYGSHDLPFNPCMSMKNRGGVGPGGIIGTPSPRYQGYNQPPTNYGSVPRKNAGASGVEGASRRAMGPVFRGDDAHSQIQQPFPSLLQEVLQGYHLDRRYGRSEQMSNPHLQSQNMPKLSYQPRHPYSMIETLKSQALMGGINVHHTEMSTGKSHPSVSTQGSGNDLGTSHPSWDSEAQRPKGGHCSSDKSRMGVSPGHSSNVQHCPETSVGAPKHINLADYSSPHRKSTPSLTMPASAVQQLLLQEPEPLPGSITPTSQTPVPSGSLLSPSSERRSVICDVSPSRRTPERERGQAGLCGHSVIQQPFSSTVNEQERSKEAVTRKVEVKTEEPISVPSHESGDEPTIITKKNLGDIKSTRSSVDIKPDHHRTSGDVAITTHNQQQVSLHSSSNSLLSPSRRQACSQGMEGYSRQASEFSGFGFSENQEENAKIGNPHQQSSHSYHHLSSQAQSVNKLQTYSHCLAFQHSMHDVDDWTANHNRHKEITLSNSVPDRHIPQNQFEQKMLSPTNALTNPTQLPRQQTSYKGTYYDAKMWDAYTGREGGGTIQSPSSVPSESVASQDAGTGNKHSDSDVPQGVMEELKPFHPATASNSVSKCAAPVSSGNMNQGSQQGRHVRTAGSGDTNPLMMRRRVRSFISPIPAKRQFQDAHQRNATGSYQPPSSHAESRHQNESDLEGHPNLPSSDSAPNINSFSPSSSSQGKTKVLQPRKGRGLKLEAIVQKITPNVKKVSSYNSSHGDPDSNFLDLPNADVAHYSSELSDQEIGARFSSGEGSCLPYLAESHSLDDVMSYRGMEDTGTVAYDSLKQSTSTNPISGPIRALQTDFDFGLGTSGTSGSCLGESDKDDLRIPSDFTLLGPLPPPPPLPRPVQGSPPPSSSALSDIQQFTNTYQQLETRRGEQSAANLLRQKLQETGMGFDEYSSNDYFGTTPPHNQSPGHHLLTRPHQASSVRTGMSMSDSKPPESTVPKGYFPSGKKKGRPVGSVNKQKRAQIQVQSSLTSCPASAVPLASSPGIITAAPQAVQTISTKTELAVAATSDEPKTSAAPSPAQPETLKADVDSEDTQQEISIDVKPIQIRQRKGKEDNEEGLQGRQRRRRRAVPTITSKDELETGSTGGNFFDGRTCVFSPYVHVERKVAEMGAVCTIINAEDEKLKGERHGGKNIGLSTDTLLNIAPTVRRDKEIDRPKEKRVEGSALQSAKALPSSGYVLSGPVIAETAHIGRLLCCLCQKWSNYKNLGDLYGPYYPSEYATRLPKNHLQIKQILANPGLGLPGLNLVSGSMESASQEVQLLDSSHLKSSTDSDCTVSQTTNPTSPATTVDTASPAAGEEMPYLSYKMTSAIINKSIQNWELTHELSAMTGPMKQTELQNETIHTQPLQSQHEQSEDSQLRPQHRKLTSHPRFKRRHKSGEDLPRTIPINCKASLPFQPPPPSLDSLGPLAQLAQLPQVPLDPEELWVHEGCIVWASGVFLVNGRLYGLQEALEGARDTNCSHCEMAGATLGCYSKGCTLRYHYICAMEADCSLNEDNFSLRCPKHKIPQSGRPLKSAYLEQSERG
ncbi:transcription factor 20 [Denticeps clupeoides]|uniref:transcription factor 20 n=1 Tax=Denticeps clupeoides TaxID=299321 RepID=UPI0010A55F8C|nr:transcription factor 20 [Denticeps clupeoides]XP_028842540.1 transcription factor 20 [Denticeps clupeoides]XP_028842541.1 transcription factor 20 [Denticeps clupeoides]XP_028842542.1 transcription factor 20 [Denticeps clupeoides]